MSNSVCPVCYSNKVNKNQYFYKQCGNCLSFFLGKIPSQKDLNDAVQKNGQMILKEGVDEKIAGYIKKRIAFLSKFILPKSRILDIGCGNGLFLNFGKELGYEMFGMDTSKSIVKELGKRGYKIFESFDQSPDNFFDTITFFDVIEHVFNSHEFIKSIKKKIKKEGLIMITTPNSQGITAKFFPWVLMKSETEYSDHLILFNPSSLKEFLEEEGFEVTSLRTDILMPWCYSKNILFRKIVNKIIYLLLYPFLPILFGKKMGDNIQIIARKN